MENFSDFMASRLGSYEEASTSAAIGFGGYEGAARVSSASTPLDSSNIGFQLLKKHGWKEGSGLGVAEQGRLEPVEGHVKRNKRGLGADKGKKASEHAKSEKDEKAHDKGKKAKSEKYEKEDQLPLKKISKAATKKMKKMLELENRLREQELVKEFYREFWPDNV